MGQQRETFASRAVAPCGLDRRNGIRRRQSSRAVCGRLAASVDGSAFERPAASRRHPLQHWPGMGPGSTSEHWTGLVDEVQVWTTQRSQIQIQQGMYRPLVGNESGLTGYWSFDGIENRPAAEKFYGNSGLLIGDPQRVISTVSVPADHGGLRRFTAVGRR